MRKSCAYEEIWGNYSGELHDDSSRLYLALYSREDYHVLNQFVAACHEAHVAHCDKYQRQDFETICGQHPEKLQMWMRCYKDKPFNYLEQMQSILDRSPGFLERNPDCKEMYDKFMAEHADDVPELPEQEEVK
jgi:hypothetical protein